MKLQAQYNRITVVAAFMILLIAAIGYYFLIRYVLISQLDETLKVEEAEILDYAQKYGSLPAATVYKDQRTSFEPTTGPDIDPRFTSLKAYHPGEKEVEPSRQLQFPLTVRGQKYIATVTKSEEATEKLIWIILLASLALILLLIVILFVSNRFLLKKLWSPFQNTLSSIKEFNIAAPTHLAIQQTRIDEFRELNESLKLMTEKVGRDYQSLKNFTDHASHEIQTPLAVINSKLDLLIQEPDLGEKSTEQVQGIYNAVEKLSRLTQSLLLLTRIENNQFNEMHSVYIPGIVEEKEQEFQDGLHSRHMHVTMQLEPVKVTMNRELAEIMISNLLRNAIIHGEEDSTILIRTGHNQVSIHNSGKECLDTNRIFDRFYKSGKSEGNGLGLAIIRQICDQYDFELTYEFANNQHCFRIGFSAS